MTNVHDWDIMAVIVMQLLLKRNFCLLPPLWAILITTSIHNSIIWVSGRKHHKRIRITVKMTWIENALKSLSVLPKDVFDGKFGTIFNILHCFIISLWQSKYTVTEFLIQHYENDNPLDNGIDVCFFQCPNSL